jgi:cation diffusion facilitator family transporter
MSESNTHTHTRNAPLRATRLAIGVSLLLALVKLVTGVISGSLALLSSGVDSIIDIFMSMCNYLGLKKASEPADDQHPYGHGKFETLATLFQGLFITASGSIIIFEGARRLLKGAQTQTLDLGLIVLGGSAVVAWFISRHLHEVGSRYDSSALRADALHYATDVYSNLGLFGGLAAAKLFQWKWMDPFLSMLIGGYIIWQAAKLLRRSLNEFLESSIPQDEVRAITSSIDRFAEHFNDYHRLRTRTVGNKRMVDLHLRVCRLESIEQAHATARRIEKAILEELPQADVTIHLEPVPCPECEKMPTCRCTHISNMAFTSSNNAAESSDPA